jgi:hypothetical protein
MHYPQEYLEGTLCHNQKYIENDRHILKKPFAPNEIVEAWIWEKYVSISIPCNNISYVGYLYRF